MRYLLTLILCLSACLPVVAASAEKPNVLFIAVDDLRPELGCYGVAYAPTPNIDRLAKSGLTFTNHFVQVPTCGASRYALLTGRSPASSGALGNNAMYGGGSALSQEVLAGAQSMPEMFRRHGYRTTQVGKISHTADGKVFAYDGKGDGRDEVPHAWDEFATPLGPWGRGWGIFFAYANGLHREDGGGHKALMEFVAEKDEDLPDGMMADAVVKMLERWEGAKEIRYGNPEPEPFFLGLGFFKPHLPFVATKADWQAVADLEIPPPPHPDKPDSPYWHGSGEFFKYDFPFDKKQRPLSKEKVLECRRAYLACVRYTDRQIGKVLDALEETGFAESTIVVLWGDHGWNLGDSAMWAKHAPFERAVRSPLIIRAPGIGKHGVQSAALVETLDVYPTLVDLCGIGGKVKPQFPLDGVSLRPVLEDPQATVKGAALSYWRDAISVRTADYRMVWSKKRGIDGVELYDTSTGFDPVKNLAGDHPQVIERLRGYLPSGMH